MNEEGKRSPKELGTEKIGTLLMRYAIPAVISMLAASAYNIVDRSFLGQFVGPLALAGLAVTFPIMNLSAAFGAMIGAGGSTLLSIKLGQRDYGTAERVMGNIVSLNVVVGFVFAVLALVFIDEILYFFGASEATLPYAKTYMVIIIYGNIITHLTHGLANVLRVVGHPNKAMISVLFGVCVNLLFDYIFIYICGWGIAGAAYATLLSQTLGTIYLIWCLCNKNDRIHLHSGIYALKQRIVKNILAIGISPFCIQVCACLVVVLINRGLKEHGGDMAIGAYGIVNSITFMFIMIVMGITQGMQPIAGYNYGAQQYARVTEVLKKASIYATIVMTFSFILCEFFPHLCVLVFTNDAETQQLAIEGMRIIVLMSPLVGFQVVVGNFFQSIGMAKKSIFLSMSRQMLFLIPLLLILPHYYGTVGVWASITASDGISIIVAAVMLWMFYKKGAFATAKNDIGV
ncbi:MAG: MATE family efflux transporter [Bacteroidaceae bacterium]|nr:MATE family efflux transporter [Bacteroidaceae bacterium]